MFKFLSFIFFIGLNFQSYAATPESDRICGRWISSEKNLIVEVYKSKESFRGKIVWFRDDPSKAMEDWCDTKNPDKLLRTRRLLGLNVMNNLQYNVRSNSWENGMIYDAKTGKEWNASAYINDKGLLKVKGYWHLKLIGRTLTFKRA